MFDTLVSVYDGAGEWADPIIITTGLLFVAGWILMFTVRLVKRFVLFTILALVLPNSIGLVGYIEEGDSLREAVVEHSEEMTEEVEDALDDMRFSPLYLSLLGSMLAASVGVAGVIRTIRRKEDPAGK